MMQKELISIIIPAYNAEKYIGRCIASAQGQTYDNIEIIVINDGSTDTTLEIVRSFQEKDERIHVIDKQNEGVSAARNIGIEKSKGMFLYYMDSDDYMEKDMLFKLYQAMTTGQSQMAVCGFANVYEDIGNVNCAFYSDKEILIREKYLEKMSEYLYTVYFGALWNKLYDGNIIRQNRLRFRKEISLAEDFIFNMDYLCFVTKITAIPDILYNYYQGNSQSLTKNRNPQYLWDMAKIRLSYCVEKYKEMNAFEQCKQNIYTAIANELVGPTYHVFEDGIFLKGEKKEKLRELYDSELTRTAITMTRQPQMVHRIAKFSLKIKSYGTFIILMKIWIKIQKIMRVRKSG